MRVKVEGYVHLARMIDKCRAVLAGTKGEYIYPCPMDDRLMEFAGITPNQFTEVVKANPLDDAVVEWLTQTATSHPPAELEAWNRMMLNRGPSTPGKKEYFNKLRNAVDPSRTDLTSWTDLQDLEEGRDVPWQNPKS
jgi:hypothetical protein